MPAGDSAVNIVSRYGIANANAIVAAAVNVGIPVAVGVALCEKESSGQNVYGNDAGGIKPATYVTKDNFLGVFLPHVQRGGTSNGVGPTQITYPGHFTSNPGYPWWDPYSNCVYGFKLIRDYCGGRYDHGSLVRAGSIYNSGSPTAVAGTYGAAFAAMVAKWQGRLNGASTEAGSYGIIIDGEEDEMANYAEQLNHMETRINELHQILGGSTIPKVDKIHAQMVDSDMTQKVHDMHRLLGESTIPKVDKIHAQMTDSDMVQKIHDLHRLLGESTIPKIDWLYERVKDSDVIQKVIDLHKVIGETVAPATDRIKSKMEDMATAMSEIASRIRKP